MKIILTLFFVFPFYTAVILNSQDSISVNPEIDKISFGVGVGLDHGGFGGNFMFCPTKRVGLFVGAGYAVAGPGLNAGIKLRFIPKKPSEQISAFLLLMYGYNAAIVVKNALKYNKFFYGPSLGFGLDLRLKPPKRVYWSFALLIPVRSSEVDQYIDDLKTKNGVEFKNDLSPLGFSFGYRFILNRN
jgi:hypothetical protein